MSILRGVKRLLVGKIEKLGAGIVNGLAFNVNSDNGNAPFTKLILSNLNRWPHKRRLIGAIFVRRGWVVLTSAVPLQNRFQACLKEHAAF